MRRIKVLHIITHLDIGGAQDNTLLTVEHLDRTQYDVTLLCGPGGEWKGRAMGIPDIQFAVIPELVRPIHLIKDITALIKMYRFIKNEKFDIVHTHSSKPGFSGRIAAKLAGVPFIVHTIHGFPFHDFMHPAIRKGYIWLERLLGRCADKMITVSKLNLEKAVKLRLGYKNQFVNIYSGIQLDQFIESSEEEKKTLRQDLNIPHTAKIAGTVGRLSEQKAPQLFVYAASEVLKTNPDIFFIFVGDGPLKKKLEQLTFDLNIEKKILFTGFREDINQLLAIFDVFVLSSLWEGLGRSLTEAMAMRCPVIATAVEGVPELVENGVSGILVNPNDHSALAEGICRIIDDPDLAHRLAESGYKRVMGKFEALKMIRDIENLYSGAFLFHS